MLPQLLTIVQPRCEDGRGALAPRGQACEDGGRDEDGVPTEGSGEGGQAQAERGGAVRSPQGDEGRTREAALRTRREEEEARERTAPHTGESKREHFS